MEIRDLLGFIIPSVLLYVGPDQVLPLLSILGTIIGFLLIWWRRAIGLIRRGWRYFTRKSRPPVVKPSVEISAAATAEPSAKE